MSLNNLVSTLSDWNTVKENQDYLESIISENGKTYEVEEPTSLSERFHSNYETPRSQLPERVRSLKQSFLIEYDQSEHGEIKVEPNPRAEELLELETVEQVINYMTWNDVQLDEMYG